MTLTVQGRLYASDGPNLANRHPLLTDTLYTSKQLWGPFSQTDFTGYKSPMGGQYLHATINYKELTVGAITWFNESGYGSEYPADRVLNSSKWQFDEQSMYVKYEKALNSRLRSKTLMQARQSGNPESSLFIASWDSGYNGTKYASYWSTINRSFSFFQDFSYNIAPNLSANFGFKYYSRILQRDYDVVDGPAISNSDSTVIYPFKQMPIPNRRINGQSNHGTLHDEGAYGQLRYTPVKGIDVVAGFRYDYNSIWKGVLSPRVGVVVEPIPNLIGRIFYGTAFLEPSSRVLYGGWQGSLSNPDIKPERMRTLEASVSYSQKYIAVGGSFYLNNAKDVISQIGGAPINLGKNRSIGADLFARVIYRPGLGTLSRLKFDAYLSLLKAQEAVSDADPFITTANVAPFKFHLMGTATFANKFDASIQGRYISNIKTVETNPIKKIDAWMCFDANFMLRAFPFKGMTTGLKIYNVLNANYWHPGYRDAKAGETLYGPDGSYVGSKGWYSSRLPQPLRTAYLTLRLDF
jgi:outer membrane receptor for ferrienterochelin and colicins